MGVHRNVPGLLIALALAGCGRTEPNGTTAAASVPVQQLATPPATPTNTVTKPPAQSTPAQVKEGSQPLIGETGSQPIIGETGSQPVIGETGSQPVIGENGSKPSGTKPKKPSKP